MTGPRERVLSVLAAAKRLADASDPLGRMARERLPSVTGLSREGVDLALSKHLEVSMSEGELSSLLEASPQGPRVQLILSAHVFVGANRALAIALAGSEKVFARPSRREDIVLPLLARAIEEMTKERWVQIVDEVVPVSGDILHVYGSDETVRKVRAKLSPGVRVMGHGSGFGVAIVEEGADVETAAKSLVWDVVPFDQRGCLSPRIVLAHDKLAEELATELARQLEEANRHVPRGKVFEDERAEASAWISSLAILGGIDHGPWGAVGVDPIARALMLPPPGRHLHVTAMRDAAHLSELLAPLAPFVTTIGHGGEGPLLGAARHLAQAARLANFGEMQRPPLDGPVDRRTRIVEIAPEF